MGGWNRGEGCVLSAGAQGAGSILSSCMVYMIGMEGRVRNITFVCVCSLFRGRGRQILDLQHFFFSMLSMFTFPRPFLRPADGELNAGYLV